MVIYFFAKVVIILPQSYDKGQLISHILFMKMPILMISPVYL